MDGFLKRQPGPQSHVWERVVADVFQPIGLFQAPMLHWPGAEGEPGLPHLSGGFYLTIDDVAKLATLLHNGGRHQGQPVLSATKLAEALHQTDAIGLPSGRDNRFGEGRYHRSFWSVPYRTATGCVFQIPYMWGNGGNFVVLLPNGLSTFRFADGHHYGVDTMVLAGEAIRPFSCPAESKETPSPARQPLTASEVRTELAGHTLYSDPMRIMHMLPTCCGHVTLFAAANGVLYGTLKAEPDLGIWHDVGRWHITADGQFCSQWHVWDGQRERCFAVYGEGETFELELQGRFTKEVYRRVLGNPEGY